MLCITVLMNSKFDMKIYHNTLVNSYPSIKALMNFLCYGIQIKQPFENRKQNAHMYTKQRRHFQYLCDTFSSHIFETMGPDNLCLIHLGAGPVGPN